MIKATNASSSNNDISGNLNEEKIEEYEAKILELEQKYEMEKDNKAGYEKNVSIYSICLYI